LVGGRRRIERGGEECRRTGCLVTPASPLVRETGLVQESEDLDDISFGFATNE